MRAPYEPLGSAKENEEWHPDHLPEIVGPVLFQKHASGLQHRSSALSLSLAFSVLSACHDRKMLTAASMDSG